LLLDRAAVRGGRRGRDGAAPVGGALWSEGFCRAIRVARYPPHPASPRDRRGAALVHGLSADASGRPTVVAGVALPAPSSAHAAINVGTSSVLIHGAT
jgi:hypothetical protein